MPTFEKYIIRLIFAKVKKMESTFTVDVREKCCNMKDLHLRN